MLILYNLLQEDGALLNSQDQHYCDTPKDRRKLLINIPVIYNKQYIYLNVVSVSGSDLPKPLEFPEQ